MKCCLLFLALIGSALSAQPSGKADVLSLSQQLEVAIKAQNWPAAADLSRKLREAVRRERDASLAGTTGELVESVLSWLPADTVTLIVAQRPFLPPQQDESKAPSILDLAPGLALGPLHAAERGELMKRLAGRTLSAAILGARVFGEPPEDPPPDPPPFGQLGGLPYQGCGVYSFLEPVPESLLQRPPDESILGFRVWVSRCRGNDWKERDPSLVAFLRPELLLVCNSRSFFRDTATRFGVPAQPRALPANLPEWKYVDRTAPVWALSHCGQFCVGLSALSGTRSPVEATGLAVEFGLTGGAVRARLLAPSNHWAEIIKHPEWRGAAASKEIAPGVWELTIKTTPETTGMTFLTIYVALGFIVLI